MSTESTVAVYDGLPGDRKPRREDRVWLPILCSVCGWITRRVDSWQTSGSLYAADVRCTNPWCERYKQTWSYHDFRGLNADQCAELASRGILLDAPYRGL